MFKHLNRTFNLPYRGTRRPTDAAILHLVKQQIGGSGGFRLISAFRNHCLKHTFVQTNFGFQTHQKMCSVCKFRAFQIVNMTQLNVRKRWGNDHLSKCFSLDLVSVTEYPEDRNLQVEVIIEIDLNTDTERAANLIIQFREQNK